MAWELGLSRFLHSITHVGEPVQHVRGAAPSAGTRSGGLKPKCLFNVDREERLLPALISALFDFEGRQGAWPPARLVELLDLAGLDRTTSSLHLAGPNLPARFFRGPLSRGCRRALLLEGLAALDSGLQGETGACFEELSPVLRGYVLAAFERGELGFPREAAERFMDCLVETVTFAFLNWELEPDAWLGSSSRGLEGG